MPFEFQSKVLIQNNWALNDYETLTPLIHKSSTNMPILYFLYSISKFNSILVIHENRPNVWSLLEPPNYVSIIWKQFKILTNTQFTYVIIIVHFTHNITSNYVIRIKSWYADKLTANCLQNDSHSIWHGFLFNAHTFWCMPHSCIE